MVQLAYGIGIARPLSVYVNSYGTTTAGYEDYDLE
jgi:S-adenosylmethionine synthetase